MTEKPIKIPPKLRKKLGIKHINPEKLLILFRIYLFTHHILNPIETPMPLKHLCRTVEKREKIITELCEELKKEGLAEIIKIKDRRCYKLTLKGKTIAEFLSKIIEI